MSVWKLLKDRDTVMKALSDYKQSEIEKIIASGKAVRSGLASQVDEATSALSGSVSSKIAEVRQLVAKPEAEMKLKYDENQKFMQAAILDAKQELVGNRKTREGELVFAVAGFRDQVAHELSNSEKEFDEKFALKKGELVAYSAEILTELSQKHDKISEKVEAALEAGMMSISQESERSGEKLKEIVESGKKDFSDTNQAFSTSLSSLSGLLNGLYETQLNNLASQSRTEIMSAAQHAEECLVSTKSELQLCLREFQSEYVAKFEVLHTRLEKSLDEEAKGGKGGMRGLKEERVRDQLNSLFRRLGQDMIDSAANAARRMEAEFLKSIESFEQRIETAKLQACESLDRESKMMQKELIRSSQDFERQIAELQSQAAMIEKHGRDSANIVMTIRQANVEF